MDQGTQEEITPVYSYADKVRHVKAFIASKYQVANYTSATRILDSHLVEPIRPVPFPMSSPPYNTGETISYFNWVVAICAGTQKVSASVLKLATEQLFTFLIFMRNDIRTDKDPFASPSIEGRLDFIWNQISELFKQLEARDKKITDVVEKLHLLLKTYGRTLEQAKKDYERNVEKIGERKVD